MVLAEIDTTDPKRIIITGSSPLQKELFNRIPGMKWSHKQTAWHMPLGWAGCLALRSTFKESLEIGPRLSEWAVNELRTRIQPCMALREAVDADGAPTLYGYQRAGVQFLSIAKRALLADEMGTGKSRQSIMALQQMYMEGTNPFPALIVAPNSTKISWKREAEIVWPGLEVVVVGGSAAKRRKQLETPAHIYVMNWESIRGHSRLAPFGSVSLARCPECGGEDPRVTHVRCEVHPRELNQLKFRAVIADECFTAGTAISTPNGDRRIEDLVPGDVIWGFDHSTGEVIESTVAQTMHREAAAVVGEWNATPNHPYYVNGEGYRALGDLTEEDELVAIKKSDLSNLRPRVRSVRLKDWSIGKAQVLQHELCGTVWGWKAAETQSAYIEADYMRVSTVQQRLPACESLSPVLLQKLLDEVGRVAAGGKESNASEYEEDAFESRNDGEAGCVLAFITQSIQEYDHGGAVTESQGPVDGHYHWSTLDSRYAEPTRTLASVAGQRVGSASVPGGRGNASVLRTGHSVQGREIDSRGGWLGASRTKRIRRSPDRQARSARLDYHPILELRDRQRYERVCAENTLPEGRTETVYSLSTTSGNYFADGLLVRNCHRMKDPKAKQTRALWAATGDADIRLALSGTPIASAPDDLWTILHWLSPEEWPSKTKYIDRMLEISYNAFGAATVIGVKPHMQEEFFAALDPRMRRMPKSVVLRHLPPVLYERRDVEMTPKQKKAYSQMVDQMVAELDDGNILVTTSPLVRMTRLLQFASSYAEIEKTWNENKQEYDQHVLLSDPSCKISAFMDDLEDFGDDSIVVFAVSRQLIEMLSDKLTAKKIPHGLITGGQSADQRQEYMDQFQAGKIKLMLCTIQAGGTGITLTRGRVAVFLQRSWSMIDNIQAEARVHRIGSEQHDTVTIVDYVTAGTVEEVVHTAVEQKSNRLEEILRDSQLLRNILKNEDEK